MQFDTWLFNKRILSHTRTVVRECFKGDEASQWKRPKFDPSTLKFPKKRHFGDQFDWT